MVQRQEHDYEIHCMANKDHIDIDVFSRIEELYQFSIKL